MLTKSIPSLFTVGNLFLGVLSIILAFSGEHGIAAVLVIVAMLLDGLDGRVARALNAQSEFGKELDSLSDVISFGVAPAFIMYVVAFNDPSVISPAFAWIVTAIFPICGALRLARFNVVAGTPGYFIGLPIPAAGGVLCTLALFVNEINVYVLVGEYNSIVILDGKYSEVSELQESRYSESSDLDYANYRCCSNFDCYQMAGIDF